MDMLPDEALSQIRLLLQRQAGWDPASLGAANVQCAVRRRMSASDCQAADVYLARVVRDPAELQELLEELAVPETWFFRDPLAHHCLRDELLMFARQMTPGRPTGGREYRAPVGRPRSLTTQGSIKDRCSQANGGCRVLSIPCSTGEEAYSLAMILREAGLEPSRFQILGVDLSARAIVAAREGAYPAHSFRETEEVWASLRSRWCQPHGDGWRVDAELRGRVEFRVGNLAEPGFLSGEPPFDVVFCRNLLIYFHPEARCTAMGHLTRLLKPQGVLIVACAEARIAEEFGLLRLGSRWPFAFHGRERQSQSLPLAARAPQRLAPFGPVSRRRENSAVAAQAGTRSPVGAQRAMRSGAVAGVMPSQPEVRSLENCQSDLLRAAFQAADQGRLAEADAACNQVLARDPISVEAIFLRGVLRQSQGALAEAQQCFDRVLYLDPRHYPALVHQVVLAEQCGQRQLAENYRRRARELDGSETK